MQHKELGTDTEVSIEFFITAKIFLSERKMRVLPKITMQFLFVFILLILPKTALAKCEDEASSSVRWNYCDFQGAQLAGANLYKSAAQGTNFAGANLKNADLRGANLKFSNLRDAILDTAFLNDAKLNMANLEGAFLGGTQLDGAELSGADLQGADLYYADIKNANFEGADLRGAILKAVIGFDSANFDGANFSGAKTDNGVCAEGSISECIVDTEPKTAETTASSTQKFGTLYTEESLRQVISDRSLKNQIWLGQNYSSSYFNPNGEFEWGHSNEDTGSGYWYTTDKLICFKAEGESGFEREVCMFVWSSNNNINEIHAVLDSGSVLTFKM